MSPNVFRKHVFKTMLLEVKGDIESGQEHNAVMNDNY